MIVFEKSLDWKRKLNCRQTFVTRRSINTKKVARTAHYTTNLRGEQIDLLCLNSINIYIYILIYNIIYFFIFINIFYTVLTIIIYTHNLFIFIYLFIKVQYLLLIYFNCLLCLLINLSVYSIINSSIYIFFLQMDFVVIDLVMRSW